jgi:hypothetical protein
MDKIGSSGGGRGSRRERNTSKGRARRHHGAAGRHPPPPLLHGRHGAHPGRYGTLTDLHRPRSPICLLPRCRRSHSLTPPAPFFLGFAGEALLELKLAFNATARRLTSWRPADPNPCGWEGVSCSVPDLRVQSMCVRPPHLTSSSASILSPLSSTSSYISPPSVRALSFFFWFASPRLLFESTTVKCSSGVVMVARLPMPWLRLLGFLLACPLLS